MEVWRSGSLQQSRIGIRPQIESAPGFVITEIEAEIAAIWIPRLPIEQVKVPLVVKVPKRCTDFFVLQVAVVGWEVVLKGCRTKRSGHSFGLLRSGVDSACM
jgi:hypothetical protein